MPSTKKGRMTKTRILNCAKELYYEQGFNKTTIQQVADKAKSTLGSMTYHFATKTEFVGTIFEDFITNLTTRFGEQIKVSRMVPEKREIMLYYVYLKKLAEDEKCAAFYNDILLNEDFYIVAHRIEYSNFHSHTASLSLEERNLFAAGNYGAHRSLMSAYFADAFTSDYEDFIEMLLFFEFSAENVLTENIDKYLKEARKFYSANADTFKDITLL